ncbi:MAG: outer membrane protein assembly factor BamB family protein [Planctomycetota bacterium]
MLHYAEESVTFLARGEVKIPGLTDLLVAAQKITPMQITAVRNRTRSEGKHFGQVLVEMDLLSQDELEEFLARQYELTVAELFKWVDGTCEYGTEAEPEEFLDEQNPPARISVPGFELVRATAMIAGAWERVRFKAPTLDTVLTLSSDKLGEIDSLPFPNEVKEDIKFINGVRTIGEFMEMATGSIFTTVALLDRLLEQGIVHPAAKPDEPEAAPPQVEEKEKEEPEGPEPDAERRREIEMVTAKTEPLETVLPPEEEEKPQGVVFQAEAEEKTGDRLLVEGRAAVDAKDETKAEKLFREAMDLFNREGTQSGVMLALDELLGIKQDDLDLMTVKLQNLIKMNKAKETEEVAIKLVAVARVHPFANAAVRALERVTTAFPNEMDYKIAFAEALVKNEERERGAALYCDLAESCMGRGMRDAAMRFFEKAHELDKQNPRYAEAIKKAKKKTGKGKGKGVGRLVGKLLGIVVFLVIVGGACLYFLVYLPKSKKEFDVAVQRMNEVLIGNPQNFAGARRILSEFKDSHPFSGVGEDLDKHFAMLDRQEAALKKPKDPIKPDTPDPDTRKPDPDKPAGASELLDKAIKHEAKGEYAEAFKLYQTILRDYPELEIELPIRIDTTPPGAEVFVHGRKIGVTPGVMRYRPSDVIDGYLEIDVRLRGFEVDPGQTSIFITEFIDKNIKLDKTPVWKWAIGRPVEVTPTVAGNVVACPTRAGRTYFFNLAKRTGENVTPRRLDVGIFGDLISELVYSDGFLYGSNTNCSVFSIDIHNLKMEWMTDISESARAKPVIGGPYIGVGSNKGTFYLLDRVSGKEVNRTSLQNSILAGAAFKKGIFYIGCADNTVRAYNSDSRKVLWITDMPDDVIADLTLANVSILAPCLDGTLYALNTDSGDVRWQFKTHGKLVAAPLIDGETIYFTSADGTVYALDFQGKEKWRFKTSRPVFSNPAIGQGRLYVTSTDGKLYAIDLRNGKEIWRYAASDAFHAGPVSAGGFVICVTKTGTVYAFED